MPPSPPFLAAASAGRSGPGTGAAAGVVNQADDKRILLSGYFTTPGLHRTTRFALRPEFCCLVRASLSALCSTDAPAPL